MQNKDFLQSVLSTLPGVNPEQALLNLQEMTEAASSSQQPVEGRVEADGEGQEEVRGPGEGEDEHMAEEEEKVSVCEWMNMIVCIMSGEHALCSQGCFPIPSLTG